VQNQAQNPPRVSLTFETPDGVSQRDCFFFREYLCDSHKDKYMAFMGGNMPLVHIESNADNDKGLLVFKDSFAHSMLPFFANHYSRITVADMRYIRGNIGDFVDLSAYEQVLFVYSVPNFEEDRGLVRLAS
jgi:hypothetical protein